MNFFIPGCEEDLCSAKVTTSARLSGERVYLSLLILWFVFSLFVVWLLRLSYVQEMNPSLADAAAVHQTVAVGFSLARSALGECDQRPGMD